MSGQSGDLFHGGVTPNIDPVLAITMRGDKLVDVTGEHEVADLALGVDRPKHLQLLCVPELYGAVLGSTARDEQALFVRTPGDRLHCSAMLVEFDKWL